jgi:hypothetical protein
VNIVSFKDDLGYKWVFNPHQQRVFNVDAEEDFREQLNLAVRSGNQDEIDEAELVLKSNGYYAKTIEQAKKLANGDLQPQ